MENTQKIFNHSTFWTDNEVLYVKFAKDLVVDLEMAKKMVLDRKMAFGTTPMPLFIDVNNLLTIDKNARRYLAGAEAWEYLTAGAIYTNNALLFTLGNAWLMIDKPIVPIEIFNSRSKALTWLTNRNLF